MNATRQHQWLSRPLLRLTIQSLCVVLAGVALAAGSALTTRDTSDAATKPSYCAASRAVDEYRGGHPSTVRVLLGRALHLAPREIAPTIRTMRAVSQHSPKFDAAKAVWARYNTNNCCTCLGGPNSPHVLVSPEP